MKCYRVGLLAEVYPYEIGKGMEDGFELWADVVTKGWIVTDFLIKITREDGSIVCPYIKHRRAELLSAKEIILFRMKMEQSMFVVETRFLFATIKLLNKL